MFDMKISNDILTFWTCVLQSLNLSELNFIFDEESSDDDFSEYLTQDKQYSITATRNSETSEVEYTLYFWRYSHATRYEPEDVTQIELKVSNSVFTVLNHLITAHIQALWENDLVSFGEAQLDKLDRDSGD